MNTLLIFFIVIILISFIGVRYRVPPFMTLVGGAVAFGLAIGGDPDTVFTQVTMGSAGVFNSLGIPILAGSVIAKYLVEQGYIQQIVSDIQNVLKNPSSLSGFAGYLIAVPSTCPITAFMILSPVLSHLAPDGKRRSALMYLVALGSTLGVAFVYPTPVTFPLFDNFAPKNLTPLTFDLVAIPLSIIFLGALILYVRRKIKQSDAKEAVKTEQNIVENSNRGLPHELDQPEDEGPVWGLEGDGYSNQPVFP
ncbi:MAG: hypothetical protein CVV33_01720 [Methanomicrobiales archaeon HGW-Methanomicrobiales-4]|nr:MAG: hypothetical protein CVV33_01720 [Methanomicrobiales archaeon HGW-Methanomicrobiales-4]